MPRSPAPGLVIYAREFRDRTFVPFSARPTPFDAEVRRVLQPRGHPAAWAYGIQRTADPTADAILLHYDSEVVRPFWPPDRRWIEDGYRGIPFPPQEVAPPAFQMGADWSMDHLLGYFGTWSATRRFIHGTGRNPIPPLAERLAHAWGDPRSPRKIVWPLTLRVGRLE